MIKTAVLGYGLAGRVFHAPLVQASSRMVLSKILSSRREEIKKHYPDVTVISSLDEALNGDEDLIVIATPNDTHYEFVKKSLEAGKHVIVDKPMTPTLKEARELRDLAKRANKTLTVFHNRRFDGDFLTIKKIIESGQLGEIAYFESNFNRFRPEVNKSNWRETTGVAGGVYFDLAPHLLDQALVLFGVPESAYADIASLRKGAVNDDTFHVVLKYKDFRAHLNAQTLYNADCPRFVLNGSKGSFLKSGMDPQEARLKQSPAYSQETGEDAENNYGLLRVGKEERHLKTESGNYLSLYQAVASAILENKEIPVPIDEAILTMELMEALLVSVREGREIRKGQDYDLA